MRIRKLLLIHPGRSTRALLKKYIYAELSDTEITEADSGQSALAQLKAGRFDVIISAEHLADMGLDDLAAKLETIKPGGREALIVISDSEANQVREDPALGGFANIVQIRVRPADLIESINRVCDPRKWRKNTRYHISNAGVVIAASNEEIKATLINISLGGILVELTTEDPGCLMNGGLTLALLIPLPHSTARIDGLTTKLLRIETVAWTKGHLPRTMRATFIFVDLNTDIQGKLAELIQMARDEKLAATEVIV
jgi:DNA-binding NarL/FixJ family response regulator